MALIAFLSRPTQALEGAVGLLEVRHRILRAPSETGLIRLVRDRPVSAALLSLDGPGGDGEGPSLLQTLRSDFPDLPVIVSIDTRPDPKRLLELGRFRGVNVLMPHEIGSPSVLGRVIDARIRRGPRRIPVWLSTILAPWPVSALVRSIDALDHRWSADDFAVAMSMSRPVLSRRLRGAGLPSAGRLLTWIRVLHAAWWLPDPGRTGGSVASQLEYSSSQALVRAIRTVLGVTPTELVARGGFDWAWIRFLRGHPRLLTGRVGDQVAVPWVEPRRAANAGGPLYSER